MKVSRIDFKEKTAPQQFLDSIHDSGFAVIHNHGLDIQLFQKNYQDWREFFESEAKFNFPFNKENQTGYLPFRSENSIYQKDLKNLSEFFNYYSWGVVPEPLREQTLRLHQALTRTGEALLRWLDEVLPEAIKQRFSMSLTEMVKDSPKHLLRIIYYPALTGTESPGEIRTSRHEDSNLITLLACPTEPGLQIEDTKGEWQDVSYSNQDLVINIGAQLKLITDGYLPSTMHRVVKPNAQTKANIARMSMPLFMHPSDEVMLTDTLSAGQFWHDFMVNNGIK